MATTMLIPSKVLCLARAGSSLVNSHFFSKFRPCQVDFKLFRIMSATAAINGNGLEVEAKKFKSAEDKLYFVKLSKAASTPTKGSKLAAGYDLKSAYKYTVPARGSCLVKTDIQIQLPRGTYGRVAPRSGLALKNKIDVGAGVIDEDYRGNVGVILFNHSDEDFEVNEGDRIAQLICEKISYPEAVEVETLEDSERGANGFGSTGTTNK